MELFGLVFSVAFVAGVIGNLVAAVIWASPAGLALARKLNRHHAEHVAQAERHHAEATAQRTAHHEALKAHVTAQSRPVSSVPLEPQQVEEIVKAAERTKLTDDQGRPVRPDGTVIPESPAAAKRREARVEGTT